MTGPAISWCLQGGAEASVRWSETPGVWGETRSVGQSLANVRPQARRDHRLCVVVHCAGPTTGTAHFLVPCADLISPLVPRADLVSPPPPPPTKRTHLPR